MSHTHFGVNVHSVVVWMSKELFTLNRRNTWSLSYCNRNWFHNHLVRKRPHNHLDLPTYKIHLPSPWKRWASRKIGRLEISEKLWLNPNIGDVILYSMSQAREKWDCLVLCRSDFWMMWRCHSILCFHFYFLFRNNGMKDQLYLNDYRCCHGLWICLGF